MAKKTLTGLTPPGEQQARTNIVAGGTGPDHNPWLIDLSDEPDLVLNAPASTTLPTRDDLHHAIHPHTSSTALRRTLRSQKKQKQAASGGGSRRILQDVITCIHEHCTIENAGFRRKRFIERHLKGPEEVARIYLRHLDAVARRAELADRCRSSLAELSYQYPDESVVAGETPQQALECLVHESVPLRYAHGLPDDVVRQLKHELRLIAQLAYARYFLTVNSIVRYARMPAGGWSDCTSGWWRT